MSDSLWMVRGLTLLPNGTAPIRKAISNCSSNGGCFCGASAFSVRFADTLVPLTERTLSYHSNIKEPSWLTCPLSDDRLQNTTPKIRDHTFSVMFQKELASNAFCSSP